MTKNGRVAAFIGFSERRSTAAPTRTKKIGTKKCATSWTSCSMSPPRSVRASTSPAANAPMISAEPARSASQASVKANINDVKKSALTTRSLAIQRIRCGARIEPITIASATKPKASANIFAIASVVNFSPAAAALTTASSTRPRMSSTTAAPRMTCASSVFMWPRSERTRAVMPTEVAVSAAPRKIATVVG